MSTVPSALPWITFEAHDQLYHGLEQSTRIKDIYTTQGSHLARTNAKQLRQVMKHNIIRTDGRRPLAELRKRSGKNPPPRKATRNPNWNPEGTPMHPDPKIVPA